MSTFYTERYYLTLVAMTVVMKKLQGQWMVTLTMQKFYFDDNGTGNDGGYNLALIARMVTVALRIR
eukprot:6248112-Ditylum_brightwellii.AAC.1